MNVLNTLANLAKKAKEPQAPPAPAPAPDPAPTPEPAAPKAAPKPKATPKPKPAPAPAPAPDPVVTVVEDEPTEVPQVPPEEADMTTSQALATIDKVEGQLISSLLSLPFVALIPDDHAELLGEAMIPIRFLKVLRPTDSTAHAGKIGWKWAKTGEVNVLPENTMLFPIGVTSFKNYGFGKVPMPGAKFTIGLTLYFVDENMSAVHVFQCASQYAANQAKNVKPGTWYTIEAKTFTDPKFQNQISFPVFIPHTAPAPDVDTNQDFAKLKTTAFQWMAKDIAHRKEEGTF